MASSRRWWASPLMAPARSSSSSRAASVLNAASWPRLAAPGGAQRPEARIEGDGVGDDGVEARDLLSACNHLDEDAQARGALGQLHETLALRADGGAEARDHVRHVAELLQDGVVGDRAHAGGIAAVARVLALALHGTRAALEQEVCPEGAEQRPVAGMGEEVLLVGAQAELEVEREIDVGIERVLALARVLAGHDDGRERAGRELPVAEEQVAVAALEARLVLHGECVAEEAPACLAREDVAQAAAQRAGVGAAAHALAVGGEDERLDARQVGLVHDVGEAEVQALVREPGRDLADEAAGIRIAGLHAQPSAPAHVVAVGVLYEQPLDQARRRSRVRPASRTAARCRRCCRRRTAWRRTARSGSSPGSRIRR